jgi:hypothetical protein
VRAAAPRERHAVVALVARDLVAHFGPRFHRPQRRTAMKSFVGMIVALVAIVGWNGRANATPCVEGANSPNPNHKVNLTDVDGLGGNQFTLTFANWPIVTSSTNNCGTAIQLDTTVVASVDAVTWLDTGTTNVVANLGVGWASNANVGSAAETLSPSQVGEAWFGFLNTTGGSAPAGSADLRVTVTLQVGKLAGDLIDSLDKTGGKKFLFTDQTDGTGAAQFIGQTLGTLPGPNIPGPKTQRGCKRAIAKEANKYVSARTKILQKCEDGKLKGDHSDPCPNPIGLAGTPGRVAADKIAKAAVKLNDGIGKKCGGKDKVCGGDFFKEVGGGLAGRPATCPDFENTGCTNAIDVFTCTGVSTCIECIGNAAVDEAIDLYYDDLEPSDPVTQEALNKCQQAIGKAVSKYLQAKDKVLQKCWDARLNLKHSDVCPDASAAITTKAKKAADAIAKAEGKKITAICKACGGDEQLCDNAVGTINPGAPSFPGSGGTGINADFTAADIFAGSGPFPCPAVTVPAVPSRPAVSCSFNMVTLADVILCLDCVTEYKADCLDPNRIPESFVAYPTECN